jgi:hypothetical protein
VKYRVIHKIDGEEVSEKEFLKRRKFKPGAPLVSGAWKKPLHCEALAVEPEEVEKQREFDQRLGLGDVEYDREGCPVFQSRASYNRYKRAYGYYDRSAGYGDVAHS